MGTENWLFLRILKDQATRFEEKFLEWEQGSTNWEPIVPERWPAHKPETVEDVLRTVA